MRETQTFWSRARRLACTITRTLALAALFVPPVIAQNGGAVPDGAKPEIKAPPLTRLVSTKETLHGVEIEDPYQWLEDQKAPETRAWIDAQNAYTNALLLTVPGREQLKRQLTTLLKTDFVSSPTERNGRYFLYKRSAAQDQAAVYMRRGPKGSDELLLDPLPLSSDHTTSIGISSVSNDGTLLVYTVRQGGEDETTPHVFDVDARKDLADRLPKARYFGFSLKPDKSGFYYSRVTPQGPRVFWHRLGSEPASDAEIFGEGYGPEKLMALSLSEDGQTLVVNVFYGSSFDRTEVWVQDAEHQGKFVPIVKDITAGFSGAAVGGQLFLRTNWKAPKGRILVVDLKNAAQENWREVVPESAGIIESVSLVGGKLAVVFSQNATARAMIFEPTGKLVREVALPAIGTVSGFSGRWASNEAFFSFQSCHMPLTSFRYDLAKGTSEIWSKSSVPFESAKYEIRQAWYTSKDGTKVPLTLTYAKGTKLDGSNPTLLTGYGGFNLSELPAFGTLGAAWLENGGVYALAHLRGGGEFGEEWHRAGMREKKQNVFDDFIAAAEWLIKNGYTQPARLAISGRSNGGLLVGAALTQRPDLFGAVMCGFPLLDMVHYHKFLVARYWVPEYGSAEDPQQFAYLHAYSPYHRVKAGTKYPAVLFITGDSDTRVDPLHARKMTALMQAATGSGRPVLLHYDTKSGHSGGTPVGKQIDDLTNEMCFLYWQLGVAKPPASKSLE